MKLWIGGQGDYLRQIQSDVRVLSYVFFKVEVKKGPNNEHFRVALQAERPDTNNYHLKGGGNSNIQAKEIGRAHV